MKPLKYLLFLVLIISTLTVKAQEDDEDSDTYSILSKAMVVNNYKVRDITTKEALDFLCFFANQENTIEEEENFIEIGGAVRFNLLYSIYEGETFPLGTSNRNDWTWDTWRLNINGREKDLLFSFEYRFYPAFNTHFIHHGWIGYNFTPELQVQLGVSQKPFGLLPYASHSWWFNLPYYFGLEDDYDMGVKLTLAKEKYRIDFAYYPVAEPRGTSEASYGPFSAARYSYDVVPVPDNSNIERNTFNVRYQYNLKNLELGASFQTGEIYNQATGNNGRNLALAGHSQLNLGRWNFMAEYIYHNYNNIEDDFGNDLQVVQMGAYGFGSYDVATKGQTVALGVSYSIPVNIGPITNVTVYEDFSFMRKDGTILLGEQNYAFEDTKQNVLGAMISAGNIYTYIDVASGYNHPWLTSEFGGTDLGAGNPVNFNEPFSEGNIVDQDASWNTRININIGYYF